MKTYYTLTHIDGFGDYINSRIFSSIENAQAWVHAWIADYANDVLEENIGEKLPELARAFELVPGEHLTIYDYEFWLGERRLDPTFPDC